jgi:hypothetical protein
MFDTDSVMKNHYPKPKLGQTVTVYNQTATIIEIASLGTVIAETPDGRQWVVSGLLWEEEA